MTDIDLVKLKEWASAEYSTESPGKWLLSLKEVKYLSSSILTLIEQLEAAQRERDEAEAELKRRDAIFPPVYPDSDEMNRMTDIFNDTVKINYEDGFVDNAELVITAIVNHWEKSRRDAQEPVAFTERHEISNMRATGLYIRAWPADRERNAVEGYTIPLYAAASAAVLPPRRELEETLSEFDLDWNAHHDEAKALGCQPEKVVILPQPENDGGTDWQGDITAGRMNRMRDKCIAAIDAAGVKWEVKP